MKINLVKKLTIDEYCRKHADAIPGFEEFLGHLKNVNWSKSKDIVDYFGPNKVRTIGNNRLRFEMGGNNHRMIIKYVFGRKTIFFFIKFIGTREEYNIIDALNVDLY